ncbi:MAG TPA: MAPEG family protein [Caldimonas sp.]|nr:MAPEG family protein [Caldimonas sp.]
MTPVFPIVSAGLAAILGLLAVLLVVRVIVTRVRTGVNAGDGGHAALAQAIRAHSNFAEHVPLALLLLAFAEAGGALRWMIGVLAAVLLVARLASAWGLSHSLEGSQGRQAGAGLTILVTVATSLLVLYRVAIAL